MLGVASGTVVSTNSPLVVLMLLPLEIIKTKTALPVLILKRQPSFSQGQIPLHD